MTKYNILNVKLSNSQLITLKSGIKNGTEVTLNLPTNLIGNETSFQHKLLLTDTQVPNIRKAFANGSSANMKFSKTQSFKIIKSGSCIIELINLIGIVDKVFNKAEDLFNKKVSLNDAIKATNICRTF